jgi:2-C-methyl-D-erythritol 4-phosphate cytidylyltransferase
MTLLKPRYWMIVPAAGKGRRFGAAVPKQFHLLRDDPVAQHTLSRLLSVDCIEHIVVPCDTESDRWSMVDAVTSSKVDLTSGGKSRANSVFNGLEHLQAVADPMDWVLVHDIARPCVSVCDIHKLISTLDNNLVGGILAAPVRETLKRVNPDQSVQETLSRDSFRLAQTPQMFRYGLLYEAMSTLLNDGEEPTDEASAMEYVGHTVSVVDGRTDNIKVTSAEDLVIAEAILDSQEKSLCE